MPHSITALIGLPLPVEAGAAEGVPDHRAERLQRVRADQALSIDEERRSPADPEPASLAHVLLDPGRVLSALEAAREGPGVEPQLHGMTDQRRALERRLDGVKAIVIRPVLARGSRAAGGLVGALREIVPGQGVVLVDEPDLARELLEERVQRPLDPTAVRSLVVGELDDRHGRVGRPSDHRRINRQFDDLRERRQRQAGGPEREPEHQRPDARPPCPATSAREARFTLESHLT